MLKILATVALLLSSFGMGMSPAAAAAPAHHGAAMPISHCPDQGSRPDGKAGPAECTMACSAALPAIDNARPMPPTSASAPLARSIAPRLLGLHPETIPPPPRIS